MFALAVPEMSSGEHRVQRVCHAMCLKLPTNHVEPMMKHRLVNAQEEHFRGLEEAPEKGRLEGCHGGAPLNSRLPALFFIAGREQNLISFCNLYCRVIQHSYGTSPFS